MTRLPCLIVSLLLASIAGSTFPQEGPLIIIGGGLDRHNRAIYEEITSHLIEDRPLCIVPTASGQPRRAARAAVRHLEQMFEPGIAIARRVSQRNANRRRLSARLETCGGFFFLGGDQSRIVDALRPTEQPTKAELAIRAVHARGGVVAGTSAGAAIMSDPMIARGRSLEAFEYGVNTIRNQPGVWLRRGIGFLPNALVDQHCLARGRFGRLLVAIDGRPELDWGLCIDEDTAVIVHGTRAKVFGTSAVVAIDLRHANQPLHGFLDGRMWLLSRGAVLDLDTFEARSEEQHHRPETCSSPAEDSNRDIWEENRFHLQLIRFSRSNQAQISLGHDRSKISVRKGGSFVALTTPDFGACPSDPTIDLMDSSPATFFAGPFEIDWRPHE